MYGSKPICSCRIQIWVKIYLSKVQAQNRWARVGCQESEYRKQQFGSESTTDLTHFYQSKQPHQITFSLNSGFAQPKLHIPMPGQSIFNMGDAVGFPFEWSYIHLSMALQDVCVSYTFWAFIRCMNASFKSGSAFYRVDEWWTLISCMHSIAEIKRKVCREVVGHVMGFHPALSNLGLLKTGTWSLMCIIFVFVNIPLAKVGWVWFSSSWSLVRQGFPVVYCQCYDATLFLYSGFFK